MSTDAKTTILIVDDDKFLLDMYATKFKASGYEILTAPGSQEALTRLREGLTPHVILLDVIMPNLDGLELLETIRKENLVPQSIIIMLTNESDQQKIDKANSLGVKGYILKATSIPSDVVAQVNEIVTKNTP